MESFRARRMEFFLRLAARLPRPAKLLDVGGTTQFWRDLCPDGFSLTILNLFEQEPLAGAEVVIGDGCDLSAFGSKQFDVVFSNSVLGHVGGWERQQQMAREIRRVGQRYFVQTPNQNFPVDWRTLVPFFHWLPAETQAWCLQRSRVGRYARAKSAEQARHLATRVRNLNRAEIRVLFPDGVIVSERAFVLTKSFMVHHGF